MTVRKFASPLAHPCCWQCVEDKNELFYFMLLCSKCGNKRCPHATNHRHECTGSNEAGQPGSIYGDHKLRKPDLPT